MSFNLDDPLAGILSDGSDDSFFDDDILSKKKTLGKKSITPIAEKKNSFFDLHDDKPKQTTFESQRDALFDLGIGVTDSKNLSSFNDNQTSKVEVPKTSASLQRTTSRESIKTIETKIKQISEIVAPKSPAKAKPISASSDKLNIIGETPDSKKNIPKPLEKGKSSQSLLDDILGGSSAKQGGSLQSTRPTTAPKSQEFDFDSFLGKMESKATLNPKNTPQKQSNKVENTAQKKTKSSSEDWLGLFQDKDKVVADDNDDQMSSMPAWLVGDSKKKTTEYKKSTQASDEDTSKEPEKKQENVETTENVPIIPTYELHKHATASNVPQGGNEDLAAESAALYLQQHESQLMVALQLKAQEERLAAMQLRQSETQRVQRESARAHQSQLDAMLQRQAEQRQQMQGIISMHQERINQRIRALLGPSNIETDDEINRNNEDDETFRLQRKEAPHNKEKKQLLQLVQALQENHDKEIDLMETSYRRQLDFLEVSVSQSEERMRLESDKLIKFYTAKINWLEEHHQMHNKLTEENMASFTERHKAENEMLRQQHLDNIKVLHEHHATLMENIKNAVKHEQALIKDSAGFSSDLTELVSDVKESKMHCQQLVEKIQFLANNTQRDTERSLQIREEQINEMIQQLKKERDNLETEKNESRDMVKMLETRLKQMTSMIEEDSASLKQKKMEFEFEKATFGKQTEFAKNILKKQEEEIKVLKEEIHKEYQEKKLKIDEEKAKAVKDSAIVAKEKASVQSLKQELEKTKAELQAQLEEVMDERSKLNLEKQEMHMGGERILAKSRDLDLLAKTAVEKQSQADKKYSEAEFLQKKYEDRIRRMQEHVVSLNAREKQIAREKVALSRERLSLHNERKQINASQQCSLCKSIQNKPAPYSYEQTYMLTETNVPVSRDYCNNNINSAMNAFDQEMSLMGRSLNIRYDTDIGAVNNEENYVDDTLTVGDTQATQAEIGAGGFRDYMDPKFMMLRLDVQQVLSNLDNSKKDDDEIVQEREEK